MTYKYFGLLGIAILGCGLTLVVTYWPQGKQRTFSQHVAQHKAAILYYIGLFSVVLPLLLLFFVKWFTPTYRLSHWFDIVVVISSVAQYACALIPETGGWKSQCHRALAAISALFLLPALAIVLLSNEASGFNKILTGICLALMVAITFVIAKSKAEHTDLLLLQSGYFIAFFAPIIVISYL